MREQYSTDFVGATTAQQTAMLDALVAAERGEMPDEEEETVSAEESAKADLAPGVHFFGWIRRMTVDAYYTSPVGIKDVGYVGNMALSEYTVPQQAIDYAMRQRPA
jgi:hypothetical protein